MRFNKIFLLLAALLPLMVSCVEAEAPDVSVDPNKMSFNYEGGSFSATITTNGDWIAESTASDIVITPSSGSQDGVVRIEVPASRIKETEAAVINFTTSKTVRDTLKTKKAKMVITREAMPFVELSANEGYVSPDGGGVRVSLSANHDWSYTATNPINGLTVKPAEGTFNAEVTISLPENTSGAARSSEVVFSLKQYPDVKAKYTIRQNAK
ncbi:MAG: BACON domain-containing protein [Bacteroidales bacterium]|nr:BACON domain-containing protein [Bacteroidales bacterium]